MNRRRLLAWMGLAPVAAVAPSEAVPEKPALPEHMFSASHVHCRWCGFGSCWWPADEGPVTKLAVDEQHASSCRYAHRSGRKFHVEV